MGGKEGRRVGGREGGQEGGWEGEGGRGGWPTFSSRSKGDYDGAIAQYILTIGKLEPSYVIRKVWGHESMRV